ncbi:FkbM family methyltransferase [soil metagenome]
MSQNLLKSIAVWSVSKGLRLPQAHWDRVTELGFLSDLLAQLKIDCVLDVGANRGQFAAELRGIGFTGRIISFEPIASEFQAMREHFQGDQAWSGHQMALGSTEQMMSITVPKLTVMSSLLESDYAGKDARKEQVAVRRLDQLLPSLLPDFEHQRLFLKMDTQGFDLEVFKGAAGCLHRVQGIQSELSVQPLYKNMPHYLEVLQCYEGAGFDLHNLSVVNRVENGGLLELNCFMRRPG